MSDFHIDTYQPHDLPGMIALFNAEMRDEPHIAALTEDRFVELVERKAYFNPSGLFVARRDGVVAGWVHACVTPGTEPWSPPELAAQIRMLVFRNTDLKLGNALVREATAWLRRAGRPKLLAIHASHGYPFYRGLWLGGEPLGASRLVHVNMALEVNGYKNTQESVMMTRLMPAHPDEVHIDTDIEFVDEQTAPAHETMRESWTGFAPQQVRAFVGGQDAGFIGWVVLPHVADKLGAPCVNIWALSVREPFRRKRIAAALIARILRLGYAHGARHASVTTQLWNAPAHATYASLGYTPHTVSVGRTLDASASDGEAA